jgi:predicted nucleic acid-binding protein
VTRDPDDNMVLECALSGRADYVVTGNTRDFPQQFRGIYVVPPRHFVVVLAASVE